MERGLTSFQKAMIASVILMLVCGASVRLYYSHANYTRAKIEMERMKAPEPALQVHVKGAVKVPGLVVLHEGARVQDALDAAGGLDADAAPDNVNLAASVRDGEEVFIPYTHSRGGTRGKKNFGKAEKLKRGEKVNINSGAAADLERIPSIGPAYAARIIELRKRRGFFHTIDEIMLVKGIGEKKFENMKNFITVGEK
jgi:competence protein ComEA